VPKKKKKASEKNETAGNSRLIVDTDAYKPFENIKEVKPQSIAKAQETKKAPKQVSQRKEPVILGYDPKANFGDILNTWEQTGELGGVTKRMKSHSKVTVEKSFAEIFSEWEGEKTKKPKSVEKNPIKKSKAYVPQKDFGDLLSQFEKDSPEPKRKNPSAKAVVVKSKDTPMKPSREIEAAISEKEELDAEKNNEGSVSWSFADTYRKWAANADEKEAIQKAQKEKKEKTPEARTISSLRSMMPQSTLDLHGMKVAEAETACSDFLRSAQQQKLLKVAIITGKGLHNDKGYSLLKEAALNQIKESKVAREAYTPKACYGGSGVIWIIMKQ